MKKLILIISFLTLWASLAAAQQVAGGETPDTETEETKPAKLELPPEYRIGVGWYGIKNTGNPMASEYDYLKNSPTGALDFEWDPLPHRFSLESYYLNNKDYFGEMDYAWKDIVLMNGYMRGLFHNLPHYVLGPDDPSTPMPSFTDMNPLDQYGVENELRRGFLRLKTPDFPLHLYADVRTIDREGSIQQRYLSGVENLVAQSRDVDWNTTEYTVGINSHLGPVEADYSHREKKFDPVEGKVLYDTSSGTPIPHNLVPELQSSSDTVKLHTTYSGKIVLSGSYTSGDRKNEDSYAKVDFRNTAGDLMFMPVTPVILTVRYRHFDNNVTNPDTVLNVTGTGTYTVNVRDSLSSSRDVVSTMLRWRATDRLTIKGEYTSDTTDRSPGVLGSTMIVSTVPPVTGQAYWDLPQSTTKNTAKINVTYRIMNKLSFRADVSETKVDNPAYATDPDKAHGARTVLTWTPTPKFNTMLSYSLVRETRDNLSAPLGGGTRDAKRDQGLASATVMLGNRSSLTASYGLYKNDVNQTITLTDGTSGALTTEPGVPYNDVSQMGSLTLTVAPSEGLNLIGSASRSYSRGNFVIAGANGVTNVSGISELSDMKVVDSLYSIGAEMQLTRLASCEIRYQYRHYDDKVDNTQDGTVKLTLATLSMKW